MHAIKRLAALAVLLTAVPAGAADPDRRADIYREFRQASEAGDYGTALPLARELAQLIEQADPLSKDLPTAYNNLGVAQFRTGELDAAERSFLRALELLEATQGIASRKMISPLAGLGAVYSTWASWTSSTRWSAATKRSDCWRAWSASCATPCRSPSSSMVTTTRAACPP
jgi:tetratricopeptide (TPR) repeat protein